MIIRLLLIGGALAVGATLLNATDAANGQASCEHLAAHPDDPDRPAGIAGVADRDLDGETAVAACQAAYEGNPGDPRTAWHLGRALIATGDFDRRWPFVEFAAQSGQPAALHLFARVLEENEAAPPDQLASLYGAAHQAGFAPAAADLDRLSQDQIDFTQFSEPQLMRALVQGDVTAVLEFSVDAPQEYIGLRIGLVRYVSGLSESLSGPFYCPGSLPAGQAERIDLYAKWAIVDAAKRALDSPETVTGWFDRMLSDTGKLATDVIESETRLEVARKAGERDAALLARLGCDSQTIRSVGETLDKVISALQG